MVYCRDWVSWKQWYGYNYCNPTYFYSPLGPGELQSPPPRLQLPPTSFCSHYFLFSLLLFSPLHHQPLFSQFISVQFSSQPTPILSVLSSSKENLYIHMRTHTGERPHKCILCNNTFTQTGQLVIHMRTHTGEEPHMCTTCGKGFQDSGNHSDTHCSGTQFIIHIFSCAVISSIVSFIISIQHVQQTREVGS